MMVHKQSVSIAGLWFALSFFMACGQLEGVPFAGGSWVVIDHKAPGISAMDRAEADAWVGKMAAYTKEKASFDGKECARPAYKARSMQADEFYSGFRVAPESLGYEGGSIRVIEVYCGERAWANPGNTLVRVGKDRLFLVWDGVFFLLQERRTEETPR